MANLPPTKSRSQHDDLRPLWQHRRGTPRFCCRMGSDTARVDCAISPRESCYALFARHVNLHRACQRSASIPTPATGSMPLFTHTHGRAADRAFSSDFSCGRSPDRATSWKPTDHRVLAELISGHERPIDRRSMSSADLGATTYNRGE